jgi:hypothetical protein
MVINGERIWPSLTANPIHSFKRDECADAHFGSKQVNIHRQIRRLLSSLALSRSPLDHTAPSL